MSVPKEDREKMDVWGYLADSACYISRTLGLKDADDSDEDLPRYRSSRRQVDIRKGTVSPEEQLNTGNCPLQIVEGAVTEEMATAAALAAQKWRQAAEMSLDSLWHKAEEDLDDLWRQMDELTRRYKRLGREARKQTLRADNMSEALGMLLPRVEWLLSFMEGEQNRKSPDIKISNAEETEILPQMTEMQRIPQDPMELQKLGGEWEGQVDLNGIPRLDKRLKLHTGEEIETMASSEPPFTSISTESSAATFATNTVPSTTTLGSERAYTSVATTTTADTTIKDSAATSWDHFQQPCPLAAHGMKQKPLMVLKPALKARTKSATDGKPKRNKKSHPRLTRQHSTKISHKSLFMKDSCGYRIAPKLHQQPSATASFPKPARRKSRLFGHRKDHYSSTGSIEVLCDSNQNVVGTSCFQKPYGKRIKADSRKTSEHSTNIKKTSHLVRSTSEMNDHIVNKEPASLHGIKMKSDSQHVMEQLACTNRIISDPNQRMEVCQILPVDCGLKFDIPDVTQNGNQLNTENNTIDTIHTQSLGDTVLRNVKYVSSSSLAVKKSSLKQECTRNTSKKSVQFVKDIDAQFYETNKQSFESPLKTTPTEMPQEEDKIELICDQKYSQISSQTDPDNCVCRKVSSKNSEVYSTVEIIKEVHTFRNDNVVSQASSQGTLRSISKIVQQNLQTEDTQILRFQTDKNLDPLQNYELYPILNEPKMAETGVESEQVESKQAGVASKTIMSKEDAEIIQRPDQNECFPQDISNVPLKKNATSTQNEESNRSETNLMNKIKRQGTSLESIPLSQKTSISSMQKNIAQNNLGKEPKRFPLYPCPRAAEICTICSNERFEADLKFENAKQCNTKTLSRNNYQTEERPNPTDNEPQLMEKPIIHSEVKGTSNDKEIPSKNNIAPAPMTDNRSFKQLRSQMNLSKSDTFCAETASVITFRSHTAITLHPEDVGSNVHQNALHYKTRNEWKDRKENEGRSDVSSRETRFLSRLITDNCEFLESRSTKHPFESYRNEKCPNVRAKLYSNNLRKKVGVLSSVSKRSKRLPSIYQITANLDTKTASTKASTSSCLKTSDVSLEYCKINLNGKKVNNSPKSNRKSISQSVDISVTPVCCSKKPNPKPLLKGTSTGVDKVDILISIKENSPARNNQPRSTTTWTNFSKNTTCAGGSLSVDSQRPEHLKNEFPRFHIPKTCFEAPHTESLLTESIPPLDIVSPTAKTPCSNRIETTELHESGCPNVDIPLPEVSKNQLIQKSGISMTRFDSFSPKPLKCDPDKADTQIMVPETVNSPKSITICSICTTPVPATAWSDSLQFIPQTQSSSRTALNTTVSFKPDSIYLNHLDTTTKMTDFAKSNTSPNNSILDTKMNGVLRSDTLLPDFIRSKSSKSDYPITNYLNFESPKHEPYGTDDTQPDTPMTDPINIDPIHIDPLNINPTNIDPINIDPIVDPSPVDERIDVNVPFPSSPTPEILRTGSSKHEPPQTETCNKVPTPEITTTLSPRPEIPLPEVNAEISRSTASRHEPLLQEPLKSTVTSEALNSITVKCEFTKPDSSTSAPRRNSPKHITTRAELVKFDSPTATFRRSKSPRTAMTRTLSPKPDTNRRDPTISDSPKSMVPRSSATRSDFMKSLRSRSPIILSTRSGSPNYDPSSRKSPRSLSPSTDPAKSISLKPVITKPGNASSDSTRNNLRKSDSARSISTKPDLSICDPSKCKSPISSFRRLDPVVNTESTKAELQRPNSCRPDTSNLDSPKTKSPRSCFTKPDMTTIDSTRPESPMIDSVKPKILKSDSIKSDSTCLESTKPSDSVKVETQCTDSVKMKNPRTSLLSSSPLKPDIPNNDTTNSVSVKTDGARTKSPTSATKKSNFPRSKFQRPVSAKRESPKTDFSRPYSSNPGTLRTHSPQTMPLRSNSPKPGSVRPTSQKLKSLQSVLSRPKSPQNDSTNSDSLKMSPPQQEIIVPNNTIPASLNLTSGKPESPRPRSPKSSHARCDSAGVTFSRLRSAKVESSRLSSPRPSSPKRESPRPIFKPGSPRLESLRPGLTRPNSPARNSAKPKVSSPISSRSGSPKNNVLRPLSPKIRPIVGHKTEQSTGKTDEYFNTKPVGESVSPKSSINTTTTCHDTLDAAPSHGSRDKLYRNQSEEKHECAADKLESLERLLDSFLCKGKDNGIEPLRKFENAARHVVDKVTRGEVEKGAILQVQTVLDNLLDVNTNVAEKSGETEAECREIERRLGQLPHGQLSGFPPSFDNGMQGLQPNIRAVSPPALSPYISTRAILRSSARVSVDGGVLVSTSCVPADPRERDCITGATKQDERNTPLRLDHLFINAASASSSSQDSNLSVTSRNGNSADTNGNSL